MGQRPFNRLIFPKRLRAEAREMYTRTRRHISAGSFRDPGNDSLISHQAQKYRKRK